MANSDDTGQRRVNQRERNNRRGATGPETKTPRKMGATRGFASNAMSGGKPALKTPKGRRV